MKAIPIQAASHGRDLPPSSWIVAHAKRIPSSGTVLDYACGSGRHALYLARLGYQVTAVDQDDQMLALLREQAATQGLIIKTQVMDLEGPTWPWASGTQFDGVIVTNYLYRPYLPRIPSLLAPGGVLLYETFTQAHAQFGKPSNPDYLLKDQELMHLAQDQGLEVLAFEDLQISSPKPACVQRLCAIQIQLNV